MGSRGYVTNFKDTPHSHPLSEDPLLFLRHIKSTQEHREQLAKAVHFRSHAIKYSASRRVLGDEEYEVLITAREYYNQYRSFRPKLNEQKGVEALLITLQESGYLFDCRYVIEVDEATRADRSRKLEQIWFAHQRQLDIAKRFMSGFLLIVDGTFNTNTLRLPLLVVVGPTNMGQTFPVCFSHYPSESQESFQFVWTCLQHYTGGLRPGVIMGDWAKGLIASTPQSFPYTTRFQGCDWHAAEAMLKWFRRNSYPHNELQGQEGGGSLRSLVWHYIKSDTEEALTVNRKPSSNQLKEDHRGYIDETWRQHERSLIYYYTKPYPKLGATSTQRVEGYHNIVRDILNAQLSLEDSVKRLTATMESILLDLQLAELRDQHRYLRATQLYGMN